MLHGRAEAFTQKRALASAPYTVALWQYWRLPFAVIMCWCQLQQGYKAACSLYICALHMEKCLLPDIVLHILNMVWLEAAACFDHACNGIQMSCQVHACSWDFLPYTACHVMYHVQTCCKKHSRNNAAIQTVQRPCCMLVKFWHLELVVRMACHTF